MVLQIPFLSWRLAFLLSLTLVPTLACSDLLSPNKEGVRLEFTNIVLDDGETLQNSAHLRDKRGRTVELTEDATFWWRSSDTRVADVDRTGLVSAKFPGTTVITAEYQSNDGYSGLKGEARVTVRPVPTRIRAVSGDNQSRVAGHPLADDIVVRVEDRHGNPVPDVTIEFRVLGDGGKLSPRVVKTDEDGGAGSRWTLSPVPGSQEAEAEAVGSNLKKLDQRTVRFSATGERIGVLPDVATLTAIGDTAVFDALVLNEDGTAIADPLVTWSVQDPTVAKHAGNGRFVGLRNRATRVAASFEGSSAGAVVAVQQVAAQLKLAVPRDKLTALGETVQLSASAHDANGHAIENPKLEWSSSDERVAVVDSLGTVLAKGVGKVLITAASLCCSESASMTVEQVVASAAVSPSSVAGAPGQGAQLVAKALDANGYEVEAATFTWSSSAPHVAGVDQKGAVTFLSSGEARITATASGGKSASAAVSVSGGSGGGGGSFSEVIEWNAMDLPWSSEIRFEQGLWENGWTVMSRDIVTLVQDPTVPFYGPNVAQRFYKEGAPAGQGIGMRREVAGSPTTLHMGVLLKISENYVNDAASLTKIFYFWSSDASKWILDARNGQDFELMPRLRRNPTPSGALPANMVPRTQARLTPGKWHRVEFRVTSASAPEMGNAADGKVWVWLDGVLTHYYDGLDTHFAGEDRAWQRGEWNTIRGGVEPPNPTDMWWWAGALFIAADP